MVAVDHVVPLTWACGACSEALQAWTADTGGELDAGLWLVQVQNTFSYARSVCYRPRPGPSLQEILWMRSEK